VTRFGQRLLKQWVSAPLVEVDKIRERLDCVEDLVENFDLVRLFKIKAKNLPDIDRMLTSIYQYSAKQAVHSIYADISIT